jgi:WD40 repeat protein/tRNA A-37 threonylcarbamoyl transferase component Bud32
MNPEDRTPREESVNEAIADFLDAAAAGRAPDPYEFIARHPEIAAELQAFFADREQFKEFALPVLPAARRPAQPDKEPERAAPTLAPGEARPAGGRLGTVRYFGDYELLQEIARGGMGVVYKARQVSLKRLVALKMILAGQLASEADVRRFYAEAEAAAKLDHPSIVPIFEVGQHEEQHYFSMALVKGESLAHKIAKGVLPPREAADMTKQVALAIAYAHVEGVVHRDLKPANVLIDKDGQPRVTDFGLAKRVQAAGDGSNAGQLTATGQVLGTPSYMPPEQAAGRTDAIGPLCDVYALGAILYCLLTGRPPFQAASPLDTLLQVLEQEPVPPRRLNPSLPRDLETIALKCLEKEPRKRYPSASALADDLGRYLNGQPIQARPTSVWERTWKWAKRRPATAALIVVLLLAGIAPITVGIVLGERANRLSQSAQEANDLAMSFLLATERAQQDAAREAEAARLGNEEAQRNRAAAHKEKQRADAYALRVGKDLYVGDMRLAQHAWDEARIGRVLELLDGQRPERTTGVDLRGFEWHYWNRLCHMDRFTFAGMMGLSVAFSPDGKRLAAGGYNRVLKIWDAATGKEIHDLKGHTYTATAVWVVAFSPDGKRLASATGEFGSPGVGEVKIWDVDSGKEIRHHKGHPSSVTGLAFSPDGKSLATSGGDRTVRIWDTVSGDEVTNLPCKSKVNGVAFSPDGKLLACAYEQAEVGDYLPGEVKIWDVKTRQRVLHLAGNLGRLFSVTFSPDGKRLAASGDLGVKVWDASTGKEIHEFKASVARFQNRDVKFSLDGTRLVAGHGSTVKVWDTTTGQELLTFKGHTGLVVSVALSPDCKRLASADRVSVKVWDTTSSQEPLTVQGEMGWWFGTAAFSPDGKRVAVGTGNGPVKVCDASTGQVSLTLKGHTAWVVSAAFSADGKRLATASHDKTVKIWDAATGEEIRTLHGHTNRVNGVAFSPDGTRVASADGNNEQKTVGQVKVWDATTGRELLALKVPSVDSHRPFLTSVVFSPDGKRLAAGVTQHARPKASAQGWEFVSGAVQIWDAATGRELLFLRDHHHVNSVAFSPDGKRVASACLVGTLKMWDTTTGEELFTFKGHNGDANSVAFSPDGNRLASGSDDTTVRVWDATTGQEALTLSGNTGQVLGVAFSPDGRRLAATGSALAIWDVTPVERGQTAP